MSKLFVPKDYAPRLDVYRTQKAIAFIKRTFQTNLAYELNLRRVSAPLFVTPESGLNDNLNGVERPVHFDVRESGQEAEIVHSLAKWKRLALREYGFLPGEGLLLGEGILLYGKGACVPLGGSPYEDRVHRGMRGCIL